jgi:hypothetical protein
MSPYIFAALALSPRIAAFLLGIEWGFLHCVSWCWCILGWMLTPCTLLTSAFIYNQNGTLTETNLVLLLLSVIADVCGWVSLGQE